ncbi:nuclear transport factor 2 family protein [Actinoplanes sp. NPDC049265]|uniref:nuclear transport factor 2 family protein n=1 Tax=Actinoplanes sp. NPDC049265 TaxID=3363902 RepID=UPI003719DC18
MTPHEIFEAMRDQWLAGTLTGSHLADDVVVEWPFAAPGRPTRIEGKEAFLAFAGPARSAQPLRVDACDIRAIHDTTDPATVIVEYSLTATAGGRQATAGFITVLTVRDDRITHLREYQDTLKMLAAMTPNG